MKTERLYTLSQWLDTVGFGGEIGAVEALAQIHKWHRFLKQPLTEEMVFNKLSEPTIYSNLGDANPHELSAHREWREYEKKVIFENVKKINKNTYFIDQKWILKFGKSWCNIQHNDKPIIKTFTSLSEIALYTKGEMPVNIEI
jgi:hypothetical protein